MSILRLALQATLRGTPAECRAGRPFARRWPGPADLSDKGPRTGPIPRTLAPPGTRARPRAPPRSLGSACIRIRAREERLGGPSLRHPRGAQGAWTVAGTSSRTPSTAAATAVSGETAGPPCRPSDGPPASPGAPPARPPGPFPGSMTEDFGTAKHTASTIRTSTRLAHLTAVWRCRSPGSGRSRGPRRAGSSRRG